MGEFLETTYDKFVFKVKVGYFYSKDDFWASVDGNVALVGVSDLLQKAKGDVAFAEGICAAEHALGMESWIDYRVVPRCVFSIPEYAAVGISEEEAKEKYPIKVARFPFKSLGMAQAIGELEGQVKIIAHAETDSILGAHIVGPHGADLISEIALAMKGDLTARMIMETIHTHPTLSEAVLEVAQALHGQAIHVPPDGGS